LRTIPSRVLGLATALVALFALAIASFTYWVGVTAQPSSGLAREDDSSAVHTILIGAEPSDPPCTSDLVHDYGADPSGKKDSTFAFQSAVNATRGSHKSKTGNIVCVPPGVYVIGSPIPPHANIAHAIEILRPASTHGGAIIGSGDDGAVTIVQRDPDSYIFSSCPSLNLAGDRLPVPRT